MPIGQSLHKAAPTAALAYVPARQEPHPKPFNNGAVPGSGQYAHKDAEVLTETLSLYMSTTEETLKPSSVEHASAQHPHPHKHSRSSISNRQRGSTSVADISPAHTHDTHQQAAAAGQHARSFSHLCCPLRRTPGPTATTRRLNYNELD